jgi:putative hemolysin
VLSLFSCAEDRGVGKVGKPAKQSFPILDPLAALANGKSLEIRGHARKAPVILDTTDALHALEILPEAEMPMGLIHDEYGHFEGIVTPADILETIAGVFRSDREDAEPQAIPRDDGSWLLAGSMPADEMADQLGITLPVRREYHTVAGFVLAHLRHLPDGRGDRGFRLAV